jgi:hypothetical protein
MGAAASVDTPLRPNVNVDIREYEEWEIQKIIEGLCP